MDGVEPVELLSRCATFFRQGKNGRASLSWRAYLDHAGRIDDLGVPDVNRAFESGDFLLIADICDEIALILRQPPA